MIVDKSFIHGLSPAELFELNVFFRLLSTPTLRMEILGDLQKESTEKRDERRILTSLAKKMSQSSLEPIEYRKGALYELAGWLTIPLHGAIPIDSDASNVSYRGGGVHIDGVQNQKIWRRWANAEFTAEEIAEGKKFRDQTEAFNPQLFQDENRKWAKVHFGPMKTFEELVDFVESQINRFDPSTQELVIKSALLHLSAPAQISKLALSLFQAGLIPRLRDYAPYAASVTKIWLVYMLALARGFVGRRNSDVRDLEYLFYAPFCRIFVSNDHIHKKFWPCVTTEAFFCDGKRLKQDLTNRAALRAANPDAVAGRYPIILEGSIISEFFAKKKKAGRT